MKVLEQGEDVGWEREITCPYCKSRLLITVDDIEYRGSDTLDHGSVKYYVICHGHDVLVQDPGCYGPGGQKFTALNEVIPEHILLDIKRRSKYCRYHR